jgi:Amt family ammonium transporter
LPCLLSILLLPATAFAQSATPAPATIDAKIAALDAAAKAAQSAGDNAWMLTSAALVLMMTGPGLALFYGGLVRKKNVLATMMQSFIMMAMVTVIWAVAGYSLAFGEGSLFIGDLRYLFLNGVGSAPNADYAGTIPQQTFMVYQLMFAIITPLFMALWALIVYFPMAHMVWGKGGLLNAYLGGKILCFDFAGGTVVHITAGVSALVCALYLGKRAGYPGDGMKPHSLVLSFIGASLLWAGWFGFNAGSDSRLVGAEWMKTGKPSVLGAISGAAAGLVAITPASGFVQPIPGAAHRICSRSGLLLDGYCREAQVWLRRFARCVWRSRRGGYVGGAADRRIRDQRGERCA